MLTKKQSELLAFLHERLTRSNVSPSYDEMCKELGIKSKSGVHQVICALEERGFIRRIPRRARALEVLRIPTPLNDLYEAPPSPPQNNDIIDIPFHGRIAAGTPILAQETHDILSVPASLVGAGVHYSLEISGDSMIDAGIFDGDRAIIRRCDNADDGDIVVALIDQDEATIKYLRHERGMVRLDPANPDHRPQFYEPERVRVQGRLVALFRQYG